MRDSCKKNIKKMSCCVCLLETPEIIEIFDDLGIELSIAEIVNKHLWFKPLPNDAFSSQICTECWDKINEFHQFYVTVERVHKDFNERKTAIKAEEDQQSCSSNIKEENYDDEDACNDKLMQIEIEIEDNKISTSDDELPPINTKNPLDNDDEESENELENDNNSEEYDEPADRSENEAGETIIKGNKPESTKNKMPIKRKLRKCNKNIKAGANSETLKKKRTSHRLDPILTDEIIKKHIQMACNLCVYVGKTFPDIVEHFKVHHENVKPYIMCCDKKFTRSYCIAQHAYIHENPNSFSCPHCNKSFTTSYGLRIHNISYHASEEERTHACDQCPRKFGRRNLLELHKQTHIPKEQWTIVCSKCTTRTAKFATQYMLNIHTSMYHRREINICQVCAKEIKDKKSFEKHVRSHFEDSGPRLKCPIENCESWLKDEDNLKTHIQRYHLDDKTYKCPDCDKVCPNRRSLSSHKHYFHSKEIFRCEQCDKTFKKALTLKEHMTQHTGETLYNCPFCTRTFNSNANMHAHKKKQHPVEWEELRRKKLGPLPN